MIRIADRMNNIPPYIFAAVSKLIAAKQAEGVDVINLGIGSPDLTPPQFIIDAMKEAAEEAISHRYPSYFGLPELRQAIADWYAARFGVSLDSNREVVPLIGSKEGIANMAQVMIDPGDVALVPDPGYPTYSKGTLLASGEVHYMPLLEKNGFLPDLEAIPAGVLRSARCIWVNYPNNPTGALAPLSWFEELIAFARENDIAVMADNPYSDVTFDGYVAPSFLEVEGARDVGVEFNSLSKLYNMAGWRVGDGGGQRNDHRGAHAREEQRGHRHLPPCADRCHRRAARRPIVVGRAERHLPGAARRGARRPGSRRHRGHPAQGHALRLAEDAGGLHVRGIRDEGVERSRRLDHAGQRLRPLR